MLIQKDTAERGGRRGENMHQREWSRRRRLFNQKDPLLFDCWILVVILWVLLSCRSIIFSSMGITIFEHLLSWLMVMDVKGQTFYNFFFVWNLLQFILLKSKFCLPIMDRDVNGYTWAQIVWYPCLPRWINMILVSVTYLRVYPLCGHPRVLRYPWVFMGTHGFFEFI